MVIEPFCGVTTSAIKLSSILFPLPLGPSMKTRFPDRILYFFMLKTGSRLPPHEKHIPVISMVIDASSLSAISLPKNPVPYRRNEDLKFNPVALGGQFQSGLFLLGQELHFDVFDTRKRLDQHHIHL